MFPLLVPLSLSTSTPSLFADINAISDPEKNAERNSDKMMKKINAAMTTKICVIPDG